MTRKANHSSNKIPDMMFIVKDETHYRTFVSETNAIKYRERLLAQNIKATLITYIKQDNLL